MTDLPFMRSVVLRPEFVPITGDIATATVMSVALFRQQKAGEGVPWSMTRTEWRDTIGIQRKQLERSRKILRDLGLITESQMPGSARGEVAYLVDFRAVASALGRTGPRDESDLGANRTQGRTEPRDESALGTNGPYNQGRIVPSTRDESALPNKEVESRERESTARPPARVATAVPTSDASDPLPEHAEALVGQLVETLATRRQAYAPDSVRARDLDGARKVTEQAFGPSLRSLARQWPDAWLSVAPLFVTGGPKEPSLHKGHRPQDIALLRTMVSQWTPDQDAPPAGRNGRGQRDPPVPQSRMVYHPGQKWVVGEEYTEEQLAQMLEQA